MITSTLTSKGQTTVPKEIRDAMNLAPGDQMYWLAKDGQVMLRAKNRSAKDLAGILHRPGQRALTLREIDDAIAAAAIERDARSRQ
jgi:AbrB family looped-hinge helix DNA binding protein